MDMIRVRDGMTEAFARDLDEGTVQIEETASEIILDGGNWSLSYWKNGTVSLSLPMNDPNYYDEDSDVFIENVLGPEVEESLGVLDARTDGALVQGLLSSQEEWSIRLGKRLQVSPVL